MSATKPIRSMTIAYLVWCFASRDEWNVTLKDLADKIADYTGDNSININTIRGICQGETTDGQTWLSRLRVTSPSGMFQNEARVS